MEHSGSAADVAFFSISKVHAHGYYVLCIDARHVMDNGSGEQNKTNRENTDEKHKHSRANFKIGTYKETMAESFKIVNLLDDTKGQLNGPC